MANAYRFKIPAGQVSGTQTNFPVVLTDAGSSFPQAMLDEVIDPQKIKVFSDDLLTEYSREIVVADGATNLCEIHIKIPSLTSGVDFYYKVVPENGSARINDTNTFTTAGYCLVNHLSEASGNIIDSLGNYNGTPHNLTYEITGKMQKGIEFAASYASDVDYGDVSQLRGNSTSTISMWYLRTAYESTSFFYKYSGATGLLCYVYGGDGIYIHIDAGNLIRKTSGINTLIPINEWHLLHFVFDGSKTGNLNRYKCYCDGVDICNDSAGTIPDTLPDTTGINYLLSSGISWMSTLTIHRNDEHRINTGALTQGWIATEFNNQGSMANFMVYDPASVGSTTIVTLSLGAANDSHVAVRAQTIALKDIYPPYVGATQALNMGAYGVTANSLNVGTLAGLLYGTAGAVSAIATGALGTVLCGSATIPAYNSAVYIGTSLGVGLTSGVTGLMELYSSAASPVLTITGLHASSYSPGISYRTDSPATQKYIHGVYSTDDSWRLEAGTGVLGARTDFCMDTGGRVGFGSVAYSNTQLVVDHLVTNVHGDNGMYIRARETTTANGTHQIVAFYVDGQGYVSAGKTNSGTIYGCLMTAFGRNAGTLAQLIAFDCSFGKYDGAGNLTTAYGLILRPYTYTGTTIGTAYGVYIEAPGGVGTITAPYPIYSVWDAQSVLVGGITILSDTNYLKLGAGSDMGIRYDGTYGIINTSLVAPSDLNLTCGANKTLALQNSVYNDANVGAMVLITGGTLPGIVEWLDNDGDATGIFTRGFAVNEQLSGVIEIPHDYKEGTNLTFHVHWGANDAPTGTDNVKWQLIYSVTRAETTFPDATTIDTGDVAYDTQYESKISNFPAITGTNFKIGDQFNFTLTRIAAAGDAYAGEALIDTVGFHYECDTIGSRSITTK